VNAAEERTVTRKVLPDFEENSGTQDMLTSRGHRLKAKDDFA
jgi:hypothetical protein